MSNPYNSPQYNSPQTSLDHLKTFGNGNGPAIALIVVASLGLSASVLNIVLAFIREVPPVDPPLLPCGKMQFMTIPLVCALKECEPEF